MAQCHSPCDFCGVLAISYNFGKTFLWIGPKPLWMWGNRKHEFYIPLNSHHECSPIELALQPPPLTPWSGVAKYELCAVLDISCTSYEKKSFLCKLTLTQHPWRWEMVKCSFSVHIWTFHSILSKICFGRSPTSLPPVRDQVFKNITFLNRYGHFMQILTIFWWTDISTSTPYWTRHTNYN